jgi:hypothetical protein
MEDRQGKARLLWAADLEHGYLTGFLTFEDIVRHVRDSLVVGLTALAKLHGLEKILGPFYDHCWNGKKEDNIPLFEKALVGLPPLIEAMFKNIDESEVPEVLKDLVESKVITWDNFVAAFPLRQISACVRESLQRAEEATQPAEGEGQSGEDPTIEAQ